MVGEYLNNSRTETDGHGHQLAFLKALVTTGQWSAEGDKNKSKNWAVP